MRVLVVNDHLLFGQAIGAILEAQGIEVRMLTIGTDRGEHLSGTDPLQPDVALVEVSLPDAGGIEAGRRILEEHPGAKVLALTASEDAGALAAAALAGFHGCVLKDTSVSQLVGTIRSASDGRVTPPRRSVARTCTRSDEDRDAALLAEYLTPREREVLGLLTEGETSTSIARLLSLSPNTVRTHIQNVLTKLGVHSRFEAASFAVRHGILPEGTRVVLVDEAGEGAA
ncbi:MAG TPA: response regulator transcription factor [Actinomycetota bacterium]|nr:response regulator transcription factor [Actinomycetota bacterium]HMC80125.1 response regulator transcription factor [Acidimicrobiia bacterium]